MMSSFKFYFVIFIINSLNVRAEISDKRLCANPDCTEVISQARTLIKYSSPDARILSFSPNVDVKILSKSAGSNFDLWGAEIKGKRGYVPKTLIREYKIIKKHLPHLVDTELVRKESEVPSSSANEDKVVPSTAQKPYEVIDGTTIYLNQDDVQSITPSPISDQVRATIAPTIEDVAKEGGPSSADVLTSSEIDDTISEGGKVEKVEEISIKSEPLNEAAVEKSKDSSYEDLDSSIEEIELNKEGNGVNKEGVNKEGNGVNKEENGLNKEENGLSKEENGLNIEENVLHEENVLEKEEKDLNKEGTGTAQNEKDLSNREQIDSRTKTDSNNEQTEEDNKHLEGLRKLKNLEIKEEKKPDSLVKNIVSSITNWISEGSGEDADVESEDDEDFDEDEEDLEDEDVSDEDLSEEYEVDNSENDIKKYTDDIQDSSNEIADSPDGIPDPTNDTPDSTNGTPNLTDGTPNSANGIPESANVIQNSSNHIQDSEELIKDSVDASLEQNDAESISNSAEINYIKTAEIPLQENIIGDSNLNKFPDGKVENVVPVTDNVQPAIQNGQPVVENVQPAVQPNLEQVQPVIQNVQTVAKNIQPAEENPQKAVPQEPVLTTETPIEIPGPLDIDIESVTRPSIVNQLGGNVPNIQGNVPPFGKPQIPTFGKPQVPSYEKPQVPSYEKPQVPSVEKAQATPFEKPQVSPIQNSHVPSVLNPQVPIENVQAPSIDELENETYSQETIEEDVNLMGTNDTAEENLDAPDQIKEKLNSVQENSTDNVVAPQENLAQQQGNQDIKPPVVADISSGSSEETISPEAQNNPGMFSGLFGMFGSAQNPEETKTLNNEELANEEKLAIENLANENLANGNLGNGNLANAKLSETSDSTSDSTGDIPINTVDAKDVTGANNLNSDNAKSDAGWIFSSMGNEPDSKYQEGRDNVLVSKPADDTESCTLNSEGSHCTADQTRRNIHEEMSSEAYAQALDIEFNELYKIIATVIVAGGSVTIFLWGFMFFDKRRREATLVAKINELEKMLLIETKENQILNEKLGDPNLTYEQDAISSEELEALQLELENTQATKAALEEQVQSLEKELENSTEVGLELNRMLSDILSSQNGSDILLANVEQLQRQLVEQQSTINSVNEMLNIKDTENHELQLELEIRNKKLTDLQAEYVKIVSNVSEVEEERDQVQNKLEMEIADVKDQLAKLTSTSSSDKLKYVEEVKLLKTQCSELQRNLDVKTNEYNLLKDGIREVKNSKNNNEAIKSLLDISSVKAELQQLQRDNKLLAEHLQEEERAKHGLQKKADDAMHEMQLLRSKYDEADRGKLEAHTKLEVLSNYFTERENQLQKELSKHESMWIEKQGEATSVTERIRYMQEEMQNCKSLNESLKQEIVSQEVQLKSQISVLEKKAHESWVEARQAERKLEVAKQEAAQLRNRLTMRERNFNEEKLQNRMLSPLEQNGELPVSPMHMQGETPASPPLLYGNRDHLTTSPPIPGLPPFLPPPHGVPFMPPPLPGVPPFMPPPPNMFPGDHRPPPLGRMSSPPLNSRYSPDSRAYSPYDRNSPSPPYDDEYGSSPPMHRGYNSYDRDERRDFRRPAPIRNHTRNNKGSNLSSGSAHSNESLEKVNRHHSKV